MSEHVWHRNDHAYEAASAGVGADESCMGVGCPWGYVGTRQLSQGLRAHGQH